MSYFYVMVVAIVAVAITAQHVAIIVCGQHLSHPNVSGGIQPEVLCGYN